MAPDLLSTIRREIDERLSELRPRLAEREQLLGAIQALEETAAAQDSSELVPEPVAAEPSMPVKPARRKTRLGAARRGSAAGVIERAASAPEQVTTAKRKVAKPAAEEEPKPARAVRGAAREAILAALDHGSHTVGELAVVTAMSAPNINGNLRRLAAEGAVVKTEREGKSAWALPGA
jgi:DNA-binding transcriptional ArsR family regulator